ncbi:MAG TPA: hypothetical protein VFY29_02040 [Terriglobia bacterium]|nr:hypothetical protein [Terriglobia bacterium]
MGVKTACIALAAALTLASCHRGAGPTAPRAKTSNPDPVVALDTLALEAANRDFSNGDYLPAARSYEEYLTLVPAGGHRDEALFHLGLIYALPSEAPQDWQRVGNYFRQLATEFPASPLKPTADLILGLRKEVAQLMADDQRQMAESQRLMSENQRQLAESQRLMTENQRLTSETQRLMNETQQLTAETQQLTAETQRLTAESRQLSAESQQREQRIKQLTTELDRLIRIDSERRGR